MRSRGEEVGVGRIRAALEANGVVTFTNPAPGARFVVWGQFSGHYVRA